MTLGYQEEIVLYIVYSYNRGHNLLDPKICIKWLQRVSVYRCIYYNIYILINQDPVLLYEYENLVI